MGLPPDQTTPLSAAVDNAATQAADIATDLGGRAERAASYLTRSLDGQIDFDTGLYNAHLADVGLGLIKSFYGWMATMNDNVALLADDVSSDYTSEVIEGLNDPADYEIVAIVWGGVLFAPSRGTLVGVDGGGCCFHITHWQFTPDQLELTLREVNGDPVNGGDPYRLSMGVRYPAG